MRALVLQHVPFEDVGALASFFTRYAATVDYVRLFEDTATFPAQPQDYELIVALGGPMSVNDTADYPWLGAEKQFLRTALTSRIPCLGICLGAQLFANALGAQVYPGEAKEIGWFPLQATSYGTRFLPESFSAFHWHGETFDLPEGAQVLASSPVCAHQIVVFNERALGLQCHLETTPESAELLIKNCSDELVSGPYIQTASDMQNVSEDRYREINQILTALVDTLVSSDGFVLEKA